MRVVIDGSNAIAGRLGAVAAKELLKGNEVVIINSELAIISGDKKGIIKKKISLRNKGGSSQKGPKVSKMPDRLLKRMIRGMLPWDRTKGREAFKRLRCYTSKNLKLGDEEIKNAIRLSHKKPFKYITIKQLSESL